MSRDTEFELLPFEAEAQDEWEAERRHALQRGRPAPSRQRMLPPPHKGHHGRWPPALWPTRAPAMPCVCPAHGTEYVRWIQSALNQVEGLHLPIDGVMSAATRSALRAFQSRQGLSADGIAGPDTEEALRRARGGAAPDTPTIEAGDPPASEAFEFQALEFEAPATGQPTLRRGSNGSAVTDLQQRLARAGFGLGLIDGIFGSQTDRAVRAFQQARGLMVDGIVGPQTWSGLAASTPSRTGAGAITAGQWRLPDSVRLAGEQQYIRYDSPPAWAGEPGHCSGTFTSGAKILRDYLRQNFPAISDIGGYNCRPNTANNKETSVHGVGRALDIYIPIIDGQANAQAGDPIANWLVEHAQEIGIQYIIWNRTKWNGSIRKGRKDGQYGGPKPHADHIHAELNLDAAARRTPWFNSR
jgi:peptidoglycan hydrolase-like protein with peptidoglycan-binding domain